MNECMRILSPGQYNNDSEMRCKKISHIQGIFFFYFLLLNSTKFKKQQQNYVLALIHIPGRGNKDPIWHKNLYI